MKDYYYELVNKKKRNNNSNIDLLFEKRRQAVDFALNRKMNKGGYIYKKPIYYINEKDINEKNSEKNFSNNKNNKFYKSYSNLKNNLIGDTNSINKSFLNDNIDNTNNYINNKKEDDELFNALLTDEELNKKYNNIKKHTINMSSDKNQKNKNDYFNEKNNNKNYEIKLSSPNNDKNNNKKYSIKAYEINLTSPYKDKNSNKKYLLNNNISEFDLLNSKISNRINNTSKNNNKQRNLYENKIYYIEGEENHRFYDSSGINDYSYNYESYKVKKYYKFKNDKKEEYDNNFNDIDNKDKKNEISPIKNVKDINENKLKNIDNSNSSKEISDNKLKSKNLILKSCSSNDRYMNIFNSKRNNQRQKSEDKDQDSHIITTIRESENTKAISIIYKSQNKINNLNIEEKEIINDNNDIIDNNKPEDKKIMNRYKNKENVSNKKETGKIKLKTNNHVPKEEIDNKYVICYQNDIFGLNSSNEKKNIINKSSNNNKKLNYNIIKERYESYLRLKSEKELNDKQKKINYDIQKSMRNNILNNIKDKINILKTNRINEEEISDHNKVIDSKFKKLKEKETNNNLLKKYYEEMLQKEDNNIKDNNIKEIKDNNIKDGKFKNKMKKKIFQKSNRFQNSDKNILKNKSQKYLGRSRSDLNQINYTTTNYSSYLYSPKENIKNISIKELKAKKSQMKDFNNNVPDINLVDDNKQIKIMEEKDYEKLRNSKSTSTINKNKYLYFSNRKDLIKYKLRKSKFGSNDIIFTPKSILFYFENKIMPPNEI